MDVIYVKLKFFSGQPSIMYFIRVCVTESFRVYPLNCSKRSLLIGRFEITKCTWWIRLFSTNSGFEFLKAPRQISKKRCFEEYCSCDQACQFSALWGTLWQSYLENLTIDEKFIKFDFLYIKRCVVKKKLLLRHHNKVAK